MAIAFTPEEREKIQRALLEAALRSASKGSARHVTVDELAREAGISKGAFYGFYKSKEHLFLDMVEMIHGEMYGNAERTMAQSGDKPLNERVFLTIYEVYRVAKERNVIDFMTEEVPLMLRRLPMETGRKLYHDDSEYIKRLIEKGDLQLNADMDTVCTVVRLILSNLRVKNLMGDRFDDAMKAIIRGACQQLVATAQSAVSAL